jgi:hypothetical protein
MWTRLTPGAHGANELSRIAKRRQFHARSTPRLDHPRQCHFEVVQQRIAAGTALDRDILDQLREDLGGTAALR